MLLLRMVLLMIKSDLCLYDLETAKYFDEIDGGWDNPYGMDISSCVIYDAKIDEFKFFLHPDCRSDVCEYLNGRKAVSFNGVRFDSRVLLGNDRLVSEAPSKKAQIVNNDKYNWTEFDIYWHIVMHTAKYRTVHWTFEHQPKKICFRGGLKLNDVAKNTLGIEKNGDGADAPQLYKDGKYAELLQYNYQDVKILVDVYKFLMDEQYLINGFGEKIIMGGYN